MKILISVDNLKKLSKMMSGIISSSSESYKIYIGDNNKATIITSPQSKNKIVASIDLDIETENFEKSFLSISESTVSTMIKTATIYNHDKILIDLISPTKIAYMSTSDNTFQYAKENVTEENLYVPFNEEEYNEITEFLGVDNSYSNSLEYTDEIDSYYDFVDKILGLIIEDNNRGLIIDGSTLKFTNERHIVSYFNLEKDYGVKDFYLSKNMIRLLNSLKSFGKINVETNNNFWYTSIESENFKVKSIYSYEKVSMPSQEEWTEMSPSLSSDKTSIIEISKEDLKNVFYLFSIHSNLYSVSKVIKPIMLSLKDGNLKFSWSSFNENVMVEKKVSCEGAEFEKLIIPSYILEVLLKSVKEENIKIITTDVELDEEYGSTILVETDSSKTLIVKCSE